MKMQCPVCGRRVKVVDPYEGQEIKRASAWFASHFQAGTRKECGGTRMVAIPREAKPASEDKPR